MSYAFNTAVTGLWRDKWVNFLCALSIATGFFLICIALIGVHNLKLATRTLPQRFTMTVFLTDMSDDKAAVIVSRVRSMPAVLSAQYISKADALADLRAASPEADYILEGLEDNPLPPSIEVRIHKNAATDQEVKNLVESIQHIEGVDEVSYAQGIIRLIQEARRYVETGGLSVIILLACAVLFVSYSTIKVLFYRRREEIQTLKLLGATRWFIRSPFLIEGATLGLGGGALGLMALLALWRAILTEAAPVLPILKQVEIPPYVYLMPVAGLLLGIVGALIAIGRIRY